MAAANHLARLRDAYAIAVAGDSKREAYKTVGVELRALVDEGATLGSLAAELGCSTSKLAAILKWYDGGCQASTPFLADTSATQRAKRSHASHILADPEETRLVLDRLTSDQKVLVLEAITSSADVVEYLADNPDAAEEALHRPSSDVWERKEAKGGPRHRIARSLGPEQMTKAIARLEILQHLLRATELAREFGLYQFLLDHLDEAREQAELGREAGDPKQAIADLEAWLAEQTEETV